MRVTCSLLFVFFFSGITNSKMMAGRAIKSCYSSVLAGVRGNVGPLLPDSMAEIAVDVVSTASSSSSLCTRGQVRAMSTASSQQPNRRTRISGNWLVVDEGVRARHMQRIRSSSIRRGVGARTSLDLSHNTIVPLALLNVQSIRSLSTLSEFDDSLIITGSCVKRIKQLQREAQNANLHLRVLVNGGGCSGFMYSFEMEDAEPDEDDRCVSDYTHAQSNAV